MQVASSVPQHNTLRIARVVRTYPDKHLIDVVFLDDGGFASGVMVSTIMASQQHGHAHLPEVAIPKDALGQWSPDLTGEDDCLAVISWVSGIPIALGFLFPVDNGMGFGEANLQVDRHVSDFYSVVDSNANMTCYHPSGAYIAIGDIRKIEDGSDARGQWKIRRNMKREPDISLFTKAHDRTASATLVASGAIILKVSTKTNTARILMQDGGIVIEADAEITIRAPVVKIN